MKLAEYLLEGARTILSQESIVLPAQIEVTPFYVAEENDRTITPHATIGHNGKIFLIGTKKEY